MDYRETIKQLGKLPKLINEHYQEYRSFSDAIWTKGILTSQEKEIIAVAVAHSTKCAYCIRFHTKKAKQLNIPLEELVEAVTITAAIEAGNAIYSFQPEAQSHATAFPLHHETNDRFIDPISINGLLSTRLTFLVALAVIHAISSEGYREVLVERALTEGVTREEIAEAVLVTAALKAGGAIAHSAELIDEYGEQ